MSHISSLDERTSFENLKQNIELQLFLRRYESALEGKLPLEETLAVAFTRIATTLSVSWRKFVKRTLDVFLAAIGLVASLPVMAIIAIAIKFESNGSVFYRQIRVGMRGKSFSMLKFRTMKEDAEALTGPIWAVENDLRMTRIGAFLRKTHLDELPQLFNVLKGEMSIVGPRPERPYFVHEFRKVIHHYDRRLCVRPGITGLAQIKRGYDQTLEDVKKKLRYDLLYVQKVCPLLDLKLMGLTLGAIVSRTGR